MDDPLSAVDANVGRHLFEKCVKGFTTNFGLDIITLTNYFIFYLIGFLKEKTCILVTHQLQYLACVDQIVLMNDVRLVIIACKVLISVKKDSSNY